MIDLPRTQMSLMLRLRDHRDVDAWQKFVEVYAPAIFAYARRDGLQDSDAADLSQEVCRKVAVALRTGGYDPAIGKFRAWLFGIVRNEVRMYWRSRSRHPRGTGGTAFLDVLAEVPESTAEETWELEVRRRLFNWACARVKPNVNESTWKAFWMLAVEEADGVAVAKATGLSVAAVYLAKSRVLSKLRKAIADMEDE